MSETAEGLVKVAGEVIDHLEDLWKLCKEARVHIDDAIQALEEGDPVEEVVALVHALGKRNEAKRPLPGDRQGHQHAFRFARLRRRRQRAAAEARRGTLHRDGLTPEDPPAQ